ncbi:hypothetical protein [Polaromonas jejuensis]|uniref:Uncharacterized protein n=1 Tax=Polaromonas jejuensis TaxID=457502 RepID=A0ABW0QGV0_9BURK|nr:hypothetical protein [Polaromonas jejuensis]
MTFTFTTADAHKLAGITAARNAYNVSNADVQDFVPLPDDQSYVQFVMDNAAQSYANQYKT